MLQATNAVHVTTMPTRPRLALHRRVEAGDPDGSTRSTLLQTSVRAPTSATWTPPRMAMAVPVSAEVAKPNGAESMEW